MLTQKMGPLPIWGWAVVALVAIEVYRRMSGTASSAQTPTTAGAASTGAYPWGTGGRGFFGGGGGGGGGTGAAGGLGDSGASTSTQTTTTTATATSPSPGNAATTTAPSPGNTGSPAYQTLPGVSPSQPGGYITQDAVAGVPIGSYDVQAVVQPVTGQSFYSYQTAQATAPGSSAGGVSVPGDATPIYSGGNLVGYQSGNTSYPLHPVQYT